MKCIPNSGLSSSAILPFALLCAAPVALASDPQVIYTEIAGSPTAVVPGALDAGGLPVATNFIVLEELALRQDGGQWMLKARTAQATTLDSILILGSGTTGTAFAQDGQPFLGGAPGEQYDFFDSPVPAAWDSFGNIAFSARAKGGLASVFEKVVVFDPVAMTHTIVLQMGDPALGLIDNPPANSGDELFGNSINSLHLLDSGLPAFVVTPITNCHSSRYPAFFHGNTSFRQSGVSAIGGETWDNFDYDDCGGTADGMHWFAKGDTENPNTAIDNILAVDDVIVLQEGSPVGGIGPVMANIFFTHMLSNGDWFCRGDDPAANDWAVRNGVLLAKTGDAISASESWGAVFSSFTGNRVGDWLLAGTTTNPDPMRDNVLVLNGTTVVAREGDPVDVDGNGALDDDAYVNTFQPNDTHLTDDRRIFLLVTLRNGAGTSIGDAFLYYTGYTAPGDAYCFGDGSLTTACPCGNSGVTGHGCDNSIGTGGARLSALGTTSPDTVVLRSSGELPTALSIFLQGNLNIPAGVVFGDGLRCVGGTLKRLYTKHASGGTASAPDFGLGDPSITARSAALGDTIPPGGTRHYQVYHRDPNLGFCANPPGNTWNVSSGRAITW
jgi:hypothetical protein